MYRDAHITAARKSQNVNVDAVRMIAVVLMARVRFRLHNPKLIILHKEGEFLEVASSVDDDLCVNNSLLLEI